MRILVVFVLAFCTCALSIPVRPISPEEALDDGYGRPFSARDIGGIFGEPGMEYPPPAEPIMKDPFTTLRPTGTLASLLTSLPSTSAKMSSKTKDATHSSSADPANPTSHSVIGTPRDPPLTSLATDPATRAVQTTTAAAASTSTSSSPPGLAGVSTQWKVMGIAVIAISGLAVMIITVVFYDQWSRFALDLLCCGKRRKDDGGFEEFVPDWEKRSWEVQLKQEDAGAERYPSIEDLAHPPPAVTRKVSGSVIPDPLPAGGVPAYANPFESHLDAHQEQYYPETHVAYENAPNMVKTEPSYPHQDVTISDRVQHNHTHITTPDPYDGIA
ncbi:hypothetical protein GLOTRDRAFT_124201 [Gloeophyllum trabeum ATCC 11539]|uniref:Mid2 domain-containing protein n=1 Tax=Gloeophyllum trabeum (strain ATCC 11539 / FP-39264 / Madison 617) TaxID=670483 RepID=S7QLX8_GLOTA|nr:uncharacterized protein GLOTRDRAFT_124201 [Gloeophyllum trabeum ATCC 11539]EPQ60447.1 hypothetical protein GLOTRDRAFT_124201 [Gloeophyllum trabeum ATCC 11539]